MSLPWGAWVVGPEIANVVLSYESPNRTRPEFGPGLKLPSLALLGEAPLELHATTSNAMAAKRTACRNILPWYAAVPEDGKAPIEGAETANCAWTYPVTPNRR